MTEVGDNNEGVVCTAVYFNPNKQQYECWLVNQATGLKIFRGCCDAIASKEYRQQWEKDIWSAFIKEYQEATVLLERGNYD